MDWKWLIFILFMYKAVYVHTTGIKEVTRRDQHFRNLDVPRLEATGLTKKQERGQNEASRVKTRNTNETEKQKKKQDALKTVYLQLKKKQFNEINKNQ